jgi:uncharacterized membrane protein SirB2
MDKEEKKGNVKTSQFANVLVIISEVLLILFGLIAIVFQHKIFEAIKGIQGLTENLLLTYGIVWIILAVLIHFVNKSIRKNNDKATKWFLFVLGLVAFGVGRLEGILTIIASITYLTKNKK